jgi:hypothetical protein
MNKICRGLLLYSNQTMESFNGGLIKLALTPKWQVNPSIVPRDEWSDRKQAFYKLLLVFC